MPFLDIETWNSWFDSGDETARSPQLPWMEVLYRMGKRVAFSAGVRFAILARRAWRAARRRFGSKNRESGYP